MENESSCKFGILPVKNVSEQLQLVSFFTSIELLPMWFAILFVIFDFSKFGYGMFRAFENRF